MDLKLLADAVTEFLAPAMPYLVAGGQEMVAKAGKTLKEDGWEIAQKLWGKLRPKVDASSPAKNAADVVAKLPDEPDARAGLRLQIRMILETDAALAAELTRLVKEAETKTAYQAAVYGSGLTVRIEAPSACRPWSSSTAIRGWCCLAIRGATRAPS
jgi:hypothetical protein